MRDALRSYLQIATGLTEMTVHRVTETARQLVEKSGVDLDHVPAQVAQQAQAVPQYVQQVADELFATGKANRDLLVGVVRSEVDKAMGRLRPWLDDVKAVEDDLERVERRVTDLEHRLAVASVASKPSRGRRAPAGPPMDEEPVPVRGAGTVAEPVAKAAVEAEADTPVAKRAITPARAAKKAAAKKAPAKKTAAKKTAASKTAEKKTTPGSGATKRTPAGESVAKKSARKAGEGPDTPPSGPSPAEPGE
ncbi:hypothetical protein [Yinghuangia sp. YIM S10712]|uniref:hypothetical protein n=1 Tax=Yinghuangia sp. YIM S10712 TaxID=3436930 RepID=UPI003F5315FB